MIEASSEHRHLVAMVSISLNRPKIPDQSCMKAEQIEVTGGNFAALRVRRGMNCVFDMVTIHGEHRHISQFWKSPEQVIRLLTRAAHQLVV